MNKFILANFTSTMLSVFLFVLPCASAQSAQPTEYEIKVGLIHNIVKFVEWPTAPSTGNIMQLCILGQSPIMKAAGLLSGKQIDGLVWEVRLVDYRTSLQDCRVLFIASSAFDTPRSVLEGIEGNTILTVSDSDGFAGQGVMVNFYFEDNNTRFEINLDAVKRAKLKVSSQLLILARIVHDSGRKH